MKRTYATAIAVMAIGIYFISCSKDGGGNNNVDCSTVAKSFSANVNPTIQSSCNVATCHAAGSTNGPGPLTTYTEVFNARTAIRSAVSSGAMPQGSSLTSSQKNSITCWIDSGAPNN